MPAPVMEQTTSVLSSCLNSRVQGPVLLAVTGLQPSSHISRLPPGGGLQRSGFELERLSLR